MSWCESKSGSQFSGGQADISWLRLSRKQDRLKPEVGALPTPSASFRRLRKRAAKAGASKRSEDGIYLVRGAATAGIPIQTLNERKPHEIHCSLSKPIALSSELQAFSRHANPANREGEYRFPSREAFRREAAINHRPVAQKQSLRSITGRSRSVTCRDEHIPRVAEAD